MKRSKGESRRYTAHSNVRYSVAVEAARLLYTREYKEYFQAKREAARRQSTTVLPTNSEIHQQLLVLADRIEGAGRQERLSEMRRLALQMMEQLDEFSPRLIGSVWTGHIRQGSDIDLNLYGDSPEAVGARLEEAMIPFEFERVHSRKAGHEREFLHFHVHHPSEIAVEITLYPTAEIHDHPTCSITGGPMARATTSELRRLMLSDGSAQEKAPSSAGSSELAKALRSLDLETLERLLPELSACREVTQNHYHHLDVYQHTLMVVCYLEALFEEKFVSLQPWDQALLEHFESSPVVGWSRAELLILAALCHDLGKPATWNLHRSGRIQFHGHENVSERLSREIGPRCGLNPAGVERLARLVGLHMQPVWYPTRDDPPSVLYRMLSSARDLTPELLLLSLADVQSAQGPAQPEHRGKEQELFVLEMLQEHFTTGFLKAPNTPVSPVDLETELGLEAGSLRDRLMERLTCDYIDGEFLGREDGLAWACEILDSSQLSD